MTIERSKSGGPLVKESLKIEQQSSLRPYDAEIHLFSAEQNTFILDSKSQRVAEFGRPFQRSIDAKRLAASIPTFRLSDIGKLLFQDKSDEDVARWLMDLPSQRAGTTALALTAPPHVLSASKVAPVAYLLSKLDLSSQLDFDLQMLALQRSLDLLPPLHELELSSKSNDLSLPDFLSPFFQFPIFDPRTGMQIDWEMLRKLTQPFEKAREHEKKKLDEALRHRNVGISAPSWLVKLLPQSDPSFPSKIAISPRDEDSVKTTTLLKSFCTAQTSPIGTARDQSPENLKDEVINVLIVENFERHLRADRQLMDCASNNGLLRGQLVEQVFGFDGLVPLSRVDSAGGWSTAHLTRAFLNSLPATTSDAKFDVPHEVIVVEPEKSQCVCTEDTQIEWIRKLSADWLLTDKRHCRGWSDVDTRIRCSGVLKTVSAAIEINLPSLTIGAASPPDKLPAELRSSEREFRYCDVDGNFSCLRLPIYSLATKIELDRFVHRWCRDAWPNQLRCDSVGTPSGFTLPNKGPSGVLQAQRLDLASSRGAGVFAVPLSTLLYDIPVSPNGSYLTKVLSDTSGNELRVDQITFKALQLRESAHPLKILQPAIVGNATSPSVNPQDLLRQPNNYIARLSLIVRREDLSQIAVSSYIRLLVKEWKPNRETSPTLVFLGQLSR